MEQWIVKDMEIMEGKFVMSHVKEANLTWKKHP